MGDKSPKSKRRNQKQKAVVKQQSQVKAKTKQDRQASQPEPFQRKK